MTTGEVSYQRQGDTWYSGPAVRDSLITPELFLNIQDLLQIFLGS